MSTSAVPAPALADYQHILRRRWLLVGALVLVILASIVADFMLGPSGLSLGELSHALFNPEQSDPTTRVIVWEIRLPYALMAMAIGLALGLSGAEMQTILNNPLASPFTLGISSAAAFGASLAIVLDLSIPGIPQAWTIAANAFIFALLSAMLLDAVARYTGGLPPGGSPDRSMAKHLPCRPTFRKKSRSTRYSKKRSSFTAKSTSLSITLA